jgi:hypothetical protein
MEQENPLDHYVNYAPQLAGLNYDPTPLKGKVPILKAWQTRPEHDHKKYGNRNIGIICGGLHNIVAVDIDVKDKDTANIIRIMVTDQLGFAPERIGNAPKTLFVFKCDEPFRKIKTGVYSINGEDAAVEVLAEGQQFAAFGIHPDIKKQYKWPDDSLLDITPLRLTELTSIELTTFIANCNNALADIGTLKAKSMSSGATQDFDFDFAEDTKMAELSKIDTAVMHVPNNDLHYDDWVRFGMAIKGAVGDEGKELFDRWSKRSSKYDSADTDRLWDSVGEVTRIGAGTIFYMAKEHGYDHKEAIASAQDKGAGPTDARSEIAEVNKEFAAVLVETKVAILREYINEEGVPSISFLPVDSFKHWLGNRFIKSGENSVPLATYWLKSPDRRQYSGVCFDPSGSPTDYYNLWKGFGVEPKNEGSCDLFLKHIRQNVCGNDDDLYNWVIGWFAQIVQNPSKKLGTSLVLRGKQGTGKTVVGKVFGKLFGPHYVQVANPRYINSQFNSHLSSCLLLQCDEGFWAGDKGAEGTLKDLVTGDYQLIEYKGKEPIQIRNHVRLIITSNNDWVVPAGFEERRFCVLDVGEDHMQDSDYFGSIFEQLENGGYKSLLHFLLNFDLSQINLRKIPDTAALAEQKIETMSPEQSWWFECLRSGTIGQHDEEWPETVGCAHVFEDYLSHAGKIGVRRKAAEVSLGTALGKMVPGKKRSQIVHDHWVETLDGKREKEPKRGWAYTLPPLNECRDNFDSLLGTKTDWEN